MTTTNTNWLQHQLDRAEAEAATWPEWRREAMRTAVADVAARDPCRCRARCDEAQTCVGGCVQ